MFLEQLDVEMPFEGVEFHGIRVAPGLKPTSFTNPTPLVSLLPPGLPPRTFACTVSSELLGF